MTAVAPALLGLAAIYAAVVLWYLWGVLRLPAPPRAAPPPLQDPSPRVSVVLAARDEAAHVAACLQALGGQSYPQDRLEIILVDDGSTDGTAQIADDTIRGLGDTAPPMRVLDGPAAYGAAGSKKAALGLAVAAASGELILTTDADCAVPETWVAAMVAAFDADVGAVVGFSQIGAPGERRGALAAWEGLDFLLLMAAAAGSCAHGHPMAASGQSLAFRRAAFDEVGGYAPVAHRVSGDDVLLLQLIRRTGRWRVAFCANPGGRVVHPPSPGVLSFLNRRARWASNAPLQLRLDPVFFSVLSVALAGSLALGAAPVLWALGAVGTGPVLAGWGLKLGAEAAMAAVSARRFGRADLLRAFPAWALLVPYYTALVGVIGCFGVFRWKGRRVAFGRRAPTPQP